MRFVVFILALFLLFCAISAQWDNDDDDDPWPNDPDNDPDDPDDPDDDSPTRPTPTADPEDPDDTPTPTPTGVNTFANATVYQPDDSTHHLTSPRTETLKNGTILIAWNDPAQISGLSIYRSLDDGFSWYPQGTVQSRVSGRKLLQPHILYIDGSWSGEKNLLLLAANAVDAKSTNIELYASWNQGSTFEFVQSIAEGGPVGSKGVAEPFILFHDKRATIYYSDQRDGQHAQKISQQSTADMWDDWSKASDISVSSVLTDYVGSPSVVKLPNNQYLIVSSASSNSSSKVQFQLSAKPESPSLNSLQDLLTTTGTKPQGPAFVTWSSLGGANGTIVVSDSTSRSLFINSGLGIGPWKEVVTVAGRAYGKEVKSAHDKRALKIAGGSEGSSTASDLLITSIDFERALASAK